MHYKCTQDGQQLVNRHETLRMRILAGIISLSVDSRLPQLPFLKSGKTMQLV
jgi:hypothetical protein